MLGISFLLSVVLFIAFGLLAIHFKNQREEYKTAVWLAMGKARQGKDADDIFWAIECYMPLCDKAHFRRNFSEIKI